MTQAAPLQTTAQATAQRLETIKAQIERQRVTVDQAQSALSALNGEGRALDLREQTLRRRVTAAEQALAAAQERVRHAQAAALIDNTDTVDAQASAELVAAQENAQTAKSTLSAALAPSGTLGMARADLETRRAQAERQLSEAQALLQALGRHAYDAHLASGQALIDELGASYDAAIAQLQRAYANAQAARDALTDIAGRAEAAFGVTGKGGGSWHASAASGVDGASAVGAAAQVRATLEQRVPLSLGRAADVVGAYDALMAAMEQGAHRVPAQIGRHALRATMPLDGVYFTGSWSNAFAPIPGLPEQHTVGAKNVFAQLRRRVQFLLEEVWTKAQPHA